MSDQFKIGINLGHDAQTALRSIATRAGFPVCLDCPGLFASATPDARPIPLLDAGVVVGALYSRESMERVTAFEPAHYEEIVRTNGRKLIEHYWGDWIAVIRKRGSAYLLRSPFGALPCLYRANAGAVIAASNIDALADATGMANTVDYDEVAFQLFAGDMRGSSTCLTEVREVRGGEVAVVSGPSVVHETLWSPWMFAPSSQGRPLASADAEILREVAIDCIAAKTSLAAKPLVMLSGGLDSSIVAACLAARGRDFACLNLVAPAAAGDEREYARAVADFTARDLVEWSMPEEALALQDLPPARLPRPVARSFEQRLYQDARAAAQQTECDAIVDGGGGDNVFCSLQTASPAADCILAGNFTAFWRSCQEIGEMTHASVWKVAQKAVERARRRSRPYRWSTNASLLTSEAADVARTRSLHPWLAQHHPGLPGRAGQIALLVAAQSFIEDGPSGTKTGVISPLVSQPLVEHCLTIPSWHWFEGGCNRAVARRAFDRSLPREVAWRRGKGMPDSFIVRLFEANRGFIRDNLIDGLLVREGVVDAASILAIMDDPTPFQGREFSRIVRLMDAEIWARVVRGS